MLDLVPQPIGQLDAIRDDTQHGCDLPLNIPFRQFITTLSVSSIKFGYAALPAHNDFA
jgi:hypothetical protein